VPEQPLFSHPNGIGKISLDLIRQVRGYGPNIGKTIEYIQKNRMVIKPIVFRMENYFLCFKDSNIISAYKRLGHSSIECIIGGEEDRCIIEIKRIIKDKVDSTDFGSINIASTVSNLERIWLRMFSATKYEEKFYGVLSDTLGIPEEIITRAVKTRDPAGITKEDLKRTIQDIKMGQSNIRNISKFADKICPQCGNVENLKISTTDTTILPHYIVAAIMTKASYMINSIPYAAREATIKLAIDSLQKMLSKAKKRTTRKDENSAE